MKLGVFDSGIGGLAIAQALQKEFTAATILTVNDSQNVPYGDKPPSEVLTLTERAIQPLLVAKCDIIILACNTATAVAISPLRNKYSDQRFIGIEPMIKSAAVSTKTKVIGVCATPATLASKRYKTLVKKYASHLTILEPDCSNWAYMIENNEINTDQIRTTIENLCRQNVDVIVLGCTHYHWIKETISDIAGTKAIILEPSEAIARRVRALVNSSQTTAKDE